MFWDLLRETKRLSHSHLRWLFQRQQCMKHPTSRTRRRPISWRSLEWTCLFWYNHRRHVPPSAKPLSLNLPFFDWGSKHQRWHRVKSEIGIIWWGMNSSLPTNLNSNNLQQKAMMSGRELLAANRFESPEAKCWTSWRDPLLRLVTFSGLTSWCQLISAMLARCMVMSVYQFETSQMRRDSFLMLQESRGVSCNPCEWT